jgi:hypothetical protein
MMRGILALAALLPLVACAPQGVSGGMPTLEAAVARLPAEVAGFARGSTEWLERERPGLGASTEYAGPARAAIASVSLYDRSQPAVTDNDPRLAAEFSSAVAEVVSLAGTRTSQQIAESGRTTFAVPGGPPLSCARLDGTYGRQPVNTLVCLGAAAGRFLKIQVTSPVRQVRPVDPMPFVAGVTQAARGT